MAVPMEKQTPSPHRRTVTFSPVSPEIKTIVDLVDKDVDDDVEDLPGSPIKFRRSASALGVFYADDLAGKGISNDLDYWDDMAVTVTSVKSCGDDFSDDEEEEDDDDNEEESDGVGVRSPGKQQGKGPGSSGSEMLRQPSWVRSMNDYMMRRLRVMEHVAEGVVIAEGGKEEENNNRHR